MPPKKRENQKNDATIRSFGGLIRQVDIFGEPLPSFNIHGEDTVKTHIGGCFTILVAIITCGFAFLKLDHLLNHHNPTVNIRTDYDALTLDEKFNLRDSGLKMAFQLEDNITGKPKSDPRYVRWQAVYVITIAAATDSWRTIPIRPRNEQDWDEFFPIEERSAETFERYKALGSLQCLDFTDEELYGSVAGGNHGAIDIMAVPCHMGQPFWEPTEFYKEPPEDCEWDKEAALKYIENLQVAIFFNNGRFRQQEYSAEDRIERTASSIRIQVDELRANYIEALVELNEMEDETDFLQYGQTDSDEFATVKFPTVSPSVMSTWPTKEEPLSTYKYSSVYIKLSQDKVVIERQTYSVLEWLGDTGGLFDAFVIMGSIFVSPLARYALRTKLLTSLFYQSAPPVDELRRSQSSLRDTDSVASKMQTDFVYSKKFERERLLFYMFSCGSRKKYYRRLQERAIQKVEQDLDLAKFFKRQRMLTFAVMALLDRSQRLIISQMSKKLLRSESETCNSSDAVEAQTMEITACAEKVANSEKVFDQNLCSMYLIGKQTKQGTLKNRLLASMKDMDVLAPTRKIKRKSTVQFKAGVMNLYDNHYDGVFNDFSIQLSSSRSAGGIELAEISSEQPNGAPNEQDQVNLNTKRNLLQTSADQLATARQDSDLPEGISGEQMSVSAGPLEIHKPKLDPKDSAYIDEDSI